MAPSAFDVLVIGAGIAGASAAAFLAPTHRVALLEAEPRAGYHTTGRSAAMWILNYGPPEVRVLSGLSRPFFEAPPDGFANQPLMRKRAKVFVAPPEQRAEMAAFLESAALLRPAALKELAALVPALKPDYAVAGAIEPDAFDMDVAAIHQGFLGQLQACGGHLALGGRTTRIERQGGVWHVHTTSGDVFEAPVIVNAAGAWGDVVAQQAAIAPLGLRPLRRTGMIVDVAPWIVLNWPLFGDVGHTWYVRPEGRTQLMLTPCDETLMEPHDVKPDPLDIDIAVERMTRALRIETVRVERSWAGLRTFTPDGTLAFGPDAAEPSFFWCVGQGGYGIQTAPAAGKLVADLVLGRDPGEAAGIVQAISPGRFAGASPPPAG